jgi:methylphosphotriester-DNA--protein-cysteine methyltransferase
MPGKLGGHKRLKIYGKLDCPNALRWINKGKYLKYRVFFADEEAAIAAGYRPCAICMKSKYLKWKQNN